MGNGACNTSGGNALVVINNTDCACVSIASITNNGNGSFTINLTNGQSQTFVIPAASAPNIVFRVQGNTLQYQINGGSWISIYTFSFAQSNTTPGTTTTTTQQILNAITVPGGTILNPGDNLNITSISIGNAVSGNPVSNGQLAGITVLGTAIPNIPLANGAAKTTINLTATMALNSSGQTVAVISGEAIMSAAPSSNGLEQVLGSYTIPQFATGVIDFTSAQQIQATGKSVTAGDLTEQFLSVVLAKQTLNVVPPPAP